MAGGYFGLAKQLDTFLNATRGMAGFPPSHATTAAAAAAAAMIASNPLILNPTVAYPPHLTLPPPGLMVPLPPPLPHQHDLMGISISGPPTPPSVPQFTLGGTAIVAADACYAAALNSAVYFASVKDSPKSIARSVMSLLLHICMIFSYA